MMQESAESVLFDMMLGSINEKAKSIALDPWSFITFSCKAAVAQNEFKD